jgi:hypothetical protein
MAIDFTGITNDNEFYTHHYLTALLEGDLKDVLKEWRRREQEDGVRPPYAQLRALAKEYFSLHHHLERERKPERRLEFQRQLFEHLFPVLGYEYRPGLKPLDDGASLPVLGEVTRSNGAPELWIIEALDPSLDEIDPLAATLCRCQFPPDVEPENTLLKTSLEEIITKQVFGRSEPPRWVILTSFSQWLLLDRGKWNEKRLLRFDLSEILSRREPSTLQAMAALVHRDSVCPSEGLSLLDTLDENAHKHAFAVSEDLKYALREAIELIGNEAVWYLREVMHEKVYGRDLAERLSRECLRYMYRLLFLFYIEARPELGYAPMKADAYRMGYSLESLRDLELVQLTTEDSRNGHYIQESIQLLFDLIYDGFRKDQLDHMGQFHTFTIAPLRSHLFDPARTPLLNRVKFRNPVLQRVIELMSLTRPKGKKDRRGRVSYVQLGINQLGAVYEALLSYRGFFTEHDLYEVKRAGETHNELDTAYFVKAQDLHKYTDEEKVYDKDGNLRVYPRGTFIYRLAGRDRQKSASYYTPEVLTRCLVKYALKELLQDKTADEILRLRVCEPAMGSAAFLNETVNQLADAYLKRKQHETGRLLPHAEHGLERQKVKMFIADNNVFGVDLNPVAVELAEVSLWLNTIYEGAFVPWFGMQLVAGNSLIGARRQVYGSQRLRKENKSEPLWLDEAPGRIEPGQKRPANTVYHFLLPDKGLANYQDKVVKHIAKDAITAIQAWRKEFTGPYSKAYIQHLEKLSSAVDRLWDRHIEQAQRIRRRTADTLHVFGQPPPTERPRLSTTEDKDRIFEQEWVSHGVRNSSPYRRLKLVMDYWCALWFWPIEKADLLPTRDEYLLDLSLILEGNLYAMGVAEGESGQLFPETLARQEAIKFLDEFGFVDVDRLCREVPRLAVVKALAEKYRFLHWELEFADIFVEHGGFDLVLGNPPWIKVEWTEGDVMGDAEPLFVLRNYRAPQLARLRDETFEDDALKAAYLEAYEEAEGMQNFLNALQNYPLLRRMQSNLYKCFLPQAWMIGASSGVSAFLHPEGVYDDPKGGGFREVLYARLCNHFQFQNQLKLFHEIDNQNYYSINIYSNSGIDRVGFYSMSNLYSPATIDECLEHGGNGEVPGIKNENNNWDFRGHARRIVRVTERELSLFAKLYDAEGTPSLRARLPALHSEQLLSVLRKFAEQPKRLGDLKGEYFSTVMWDETNAVKKDGTIRRNTRFPDNTNEWILSGPHFYVGNPFFKTPQRICKTNRSYHCCPVNNIMKSI